MDPRGFAAAPSDPPFKYKKAAPSLLQTTSSQPPFHFSKHPYPLNLIAKMASAESDLVRCYDNGRALHANIGLKRTQKMCGNMIAGSKSVKRQAPEGSRDRPIVIDDDVDSPKQTASTQGPINEKHRIRKRAPKMRGSL